MSATQNLLAIFTILSFCSLQVCNGKKVAMKVVEEPSSYGNYGGYQDPVNQETQKLKMRIPPSNFSGPQHFKRLVGKCFSAVQDSYKYELCPFSNITQHEQSLRWNPYSGVLGVWEEWEIENNTFVAMLMAEGDACGSVHRSVKVVLKCGNKTSIGHVSEPQTCRYQMIFYTPLACHPHALLVYPTLSQELRDKWDIVETELNEGLLTQKGYQKKLRSIFEKAGYQISQTKKDDLMKAAEKEEEKEKLSHKKEFDTLYECNEEYKKLQDEVASMKELLEKNNITYQLPAVRQDDFGEVAERQDGFGQEEADFHDRFGDAKDYEDYMDAAIGL